MKASDWGRLAAVMTAVLPLLGGAAEPPSVATPGAAAAHPPATMESATSLRLSPSQYQQTIADIFGDSIKIDGRFEPEQRDQGLLAIGARTENFTDSGLESYYHIAKSIAAEVVDSRHRATLIGCIPSSQNSRDDQCARAFFARVGPQLYRRPLTEDEVQARVATAGMASEQLHDFYAGVRQSLSEMLISPDFLLRFRRMESDAAHPGQERMNAYDKASELSYFLWNTSPDPQLMQAARGGQLYTQAGLARQVNRLLGSPDVSNGIRALFADLLGFSDFEAVSKDPSFFPRYTPNIADEAQEQTLRTIVDHIVNRHADYRDLFTTPHTFLTADLAALYEVPLVDRTDNGQPQRWVPYTYPAGDPRVGILSQVSFTALWSPAGRTSPTGRGKALRMHVLCERVPPPPGNVSFKFVDDTSNPQYKTTRERLMAHRTNPVCAGCHKLTDPIGLSLENFDSAGEFRTTENGVLIDASGELDGQQFMGPQGLSRAMHDDPATTHCLAQRAFAFATGSMPTSNDPGWQQIEQTFASSHYDVIELLRAIALSDLAYSAPESAVLSAVNQ